MLLKNIVGIYWIFLKSSIDRVIITNLEGLLATHPDVNAVIKLSAHSSSIPVRVRELFVAVTTAYLTI